MTMILRSITGDSFDLHMQMPHMHWRDYTVLYDHELSDERKYAMLHLLDREVLAARESYVPPVLRVELHGTKDPRLQGYIVVVFETTLTKVYEYNPYDGSKAT